MIGNQGLLIGSCFTGPVIGLLDQLRVCFYPLFIKLLSGSMLSVPVSCGLSFIILLIATKPHRDSNDNPEGEDSNMRLCVHNTIICGIKVKTFSTKTTSLRLY